MRFFKRGEGSKDQKDNFVPKPEELKIISPWINNLDIRMIGNEGEEGLNDKIMNSKELDEGRVDKLCEWAMERRREVVIQSQERRV